MPSIAVPNIDPLKNLPKDLPTGPVGNAIAGPDTLSKDLPSGPMDLAMPTPNELSKEIGSTADLPKKP